MSESRAVVAVERAVTAYDRFKHVVSDPHSLEVIGQRVMEGDTLKRVARDWGVPVMQFIAWVTGDPDRNAVYEAALRIRADEMVGELVPIADGGEDVARDKLRIETRAKLAAYFDRQRFGDTKARAPAARVTVDRSCGRERDSLTVEVE